MTVRGKYIVIEGHDGTGKSTQVELMRKYLAERGIKSVEMHEPGGVPIADKIRSVVKDGTLERDSTTNLLLFTAARRELWNQLAKPALERGEWVIAARNWYSTLAYQGYGEGVAAELIAKVTRNFMDDRYINPDFSVILALESDAARKARIKERGLAPARHDHFEAQDEAYQQKVHDGYRHIARDLSIQIIDATKTREEILEVIIKLISSTDERLALF